MNVKFPGQKNKNLAYSKITSVEEIDNRLEIVYDQKLLTLDLSEIREDDRFKLVNMLKKHTLTEGN